MSSFNNLMNQYRGVGVSGRRQSSLETTRDPVFGEDSLTVDDLVQDRQYLNPIREYMIERKGCLLYTSPSPRDS